MTNREAVTKMGELMQELEAGRLTLREYAIEWERYVLPVAGDLENAHIDGDHEEHGHRACPICAEDL